MLNREHIFEQIEAHIRASAGERFAVLMLRVPGLREISLRFGYTQGEQAGDMAHALIQRSLRPVDRVFAPARTVSWCCCRRCSAPITPCSPARA